MGVAIGKPVHCLMPRLLIIFVLNIVVLGCGGMSQIPRNAECAPVSYPEGKRIDSVSYEVRSYRTNDPLPEVIGFFDRQLEPIPLWRDWNSGMWRAERIDDSQVLYECYAVMEDFLQDVESGCILVKEEAGGILIETVWYLSADTGHPCEPDLSVERSLE